MTSLVSAAWLPNCIRKLILPTSFISWVVSRSWSNFVIWFGASPAAQWAKDRTYFSSTSPCSSYAAKYHTISLRTTSWCEKHPCWFWIFEYMTSLVSATWFPSGVAKMSGTFLRQGPKMWERPKSPLRFFRSVYLWRIKPKIHNV